VAGAMVRVRARATRAPRVSKSMSVRGNENENGDVEIVELD